jgi:hypothetical protein
MDWELYFTALAVLATVAVFKIIREAIWWHRVEKKTHQILEDIESE